MAKDPAFLFYSQDFYVGTALMSFEDRGKYITLLCLMHQQGRMPEETIRLLVGSVSNRLRCKFLVDENGLWYNERLEAEAEKRIKFTESRRSNGLLGGRPKASGYPIGVATENLAENENNISSKVVSKEKKERTTLKEKSTTVFNPINHIPISWNEDLFMAEWDDFMQMKPGKGAQLARSAGAGVQLVAREGQYATLRLRSGEMRRVMVDCRATIGEVSNSEHNLRSLGKAGAKRWRGIRPTVRGVVMNPVDHPHGGGEGRTSGGRHPVSPWGTPTKGYKTRSNKRTDSMIVRRRGKK